MNSKSISKTIEIMNQLEKAGEFDFDGWWSAARIPFLENGGGGHLCVDSNTGEVLEFWHDGPERSIIAPSLEIWLEIFVTTLEAGAWELDSDTGGFWADEGTVTQTHKSLAPGYPKRHDATDKGERPASPIVPLTGMGNIDRERAQQVLDAWGSWIGRPLALPRYAPYVIREPKQ